MYFSFFFPIGQCLLKTNNRFLPANITRVGVTVAVCAVWPSVPMTHTRRGPTCHVAVGQHARRARARPLIADLVISVLTCRTPESTDRRSSPQSRVLRCPTYLLLDLHLRVSKKVTKLLFYESSLHRTLGAACGCSPPRALSVHTRPLFHEPHRTSGGVTGS